MLKINVSILIAVLLLQFFQVAPAAGQTANRAAADMETVKIKADLAKRGTGKKSKVKIQTRDGRAVKGYLAELNADDFVVADSKTDERTTIVYANVSKIKKPGLSTGAKFGIAALIVGAIAATVVAVGVKNLEDDIFPN